jgi:hypothetical protein
MKLYRGYVTEGFASDRGRLKSAIDISKALSENNRINPRSSQLVDQLVWVTPDFSYAGAIATSRFIATISLDSNKLASKDVNPIVLEFDTLGNDNLLYGVKNKNVHVLSKGEITEQIIAQDLSLSVMKYLLPVVGDREQLVRYLTHSNPGDVDTILRITTLFQMQCGVKFEKIFQISTLDNQSVIDGVGIVLRHVQQLGYAKDSQENVNILARGIFVYTTLFEDFMRFRECEDISRLPEGTRSNLSSEGIR